MALLNVDLLKLLQQRVSVPRLQAPAPTLGELEEVFKAALRAADHGKLQPRRFLVITEQGLARLSEVFVDALLKANPDPSPAVLDKTRNMPNRAPMIVVAIASYQDHPSVSRQEQVIACGAAVQNMLNAFFALGYGAVWRSGEMAQNADVNNQLGLGAHEEIIGFIYVGTPAQAIPQVPVVDVQAIFKQWPLE